MYILTIYDHMIHPDLPVSKPESLMDRKTISPFPHFAIYPTWLKPNP